MDKSYRKIVKEYTNKLLPLNHVVGVGYGKKMKNNIDTGENCIIVMVDEKVPEDRLEKKDIIPQELEDLKTDVQEVGQLKLQETPRNKRFRPAPGGVSIGHFNITAGTLGAIVKDKNTGEPLILSNNHVLANITNGRDGRAKIGDPILQPGVYDNGSRENDTIGHLTRFIPLEPSRSIFNPTTNTVDCALAKPVDKKIIENSILEVGEINGVKEAEVGMTVIKSGRTTGLTETTIKAVDSTVRVSLDSKNEAIFTDQIVTESFSEGGDSGSLVLDKERNAVGLLFAGSDKATICNKITNVMKELDIDFYSNTEEKKEKTKENSNNTEKINDPYNIFLIFFLLILNLAYRKI